MQYLFEILHAPQKKLISFSVLYLPGKNVLQAPSCNNIAILDHGEVLSQTSLDAVARECGGSKKVPKRSFVPSEVLAHGYRYLYTLIHRFVVTLMSKKDSRRKS